MKALVNPDLYRPIVRIIDDEETVRNSEAFTLRVVGLETACYATAEEFLEKDDLRYPGCIILDVRMPGMSGPELQQEINKREIDLPIIFLSAHGNIGLAVDTLKRGAKDFYEKPVEPEKLRETAARLVEENLQARRKLYETQMLHAQYEALTNRERMILKLVAQNLSNKVIADQLQIQEHTVKIHRGNACHKLNIRTALEVHQFLTLILQVLVLHKLWAFLLFFHLYLK